MRIALALLGITAIAAGTAYFIAPNKPYCQVPSLPPVETPGVQAVGYTQEDDTDYETPEQPGLEIGDEAPELILLDAAGSEVNLADLYADGPVVLTFYRGGWCPYCTRALSAWAKKLPELTEAGGTFVGLTLEKPEYIATTKTKHELEYTVLSDTEGEAARAFMVQFSLDERTIEKYKGYGIDLTEHNADGEWTLPAPATFVIDTDGVIQWVWADWDYSKRADPDDVIDAVKKITG